MSTNVLGVDIGGVIIDRINDNTDTSFFTENFLRTTPVSGVFVALRTLVDTHYGDRVFLVSKCGQAVQAKTFQWLDHYDFYRLTGIRRDHVYFCRQRSEKAGICKDLGITRFVDDRLEVLGTLLDLDVRYLFQPRPEEVKKFAHFADKVITVQSWKEIVQQEGWCDRFIASLTLVYEAVFCYIGNYQYQSTF